jgi:hypothetical protein
VFGDLVELADEAERHAQAGIEAGKKSRRIGVNVNVAIHWAALAGDALSLLEGAGLMPSPSQHELQRDEEATWGPSPAPRMRLLAWRPMVKNSLHGFATVELPSELQISDIPLLQSHGKAWASLPGKPQIDAEGRHKRDINGRPSYVKILEWRDRELSDKFSEAIVALFCAAHPDALEVGH